MFPSQDWSHPAEEPTIQQTHEITLEDLCDATDRDTLRAACRRFLPDAASLFAAMRSSGDGFTYCFATD